LAIRISPVAFDRFDQVISEIAKETAGSTDFKISLLPAYSEGQASL
jgi:hypothetical protein